MSEIYDSKFYEDQFAGSARSAAAVVPLILGLFPSTRSVIDIGCGTGVWLHQYQLLGVPRILGLDSGNPPPNLLKIDEAEFLHVNLSGPFGVQERFDLAMSLEVAEHLDEAFAKSFVSNLTGLSDIIVFGAAIPGQGGTNHVNERWPSYWNALFEERGFRCFDVLRGQFWHNDLVEWWYAQNILVFVKKSRLDLVADLEKKIISNKVPIDLVHPRCFEVYKRWLDDMLGNVDAGLADSTGQVSLERNLLKSLQERLNAIELSTSWRVMRVLQRAVARLPIIRGFLRFSAKWIK